MRQRKLQVFLSSTYSDLVDERLAAMEAILAAGHIPAAMEQFSAGDEEALEKIKRWIDNSDCYILILGGRYGSIEPKSGKSYTQLEYEYALEQGKPFISIVMNDEVVDRKVNEGRKHTELTEQVEPQLHKDFKTLVMAKHCAFWSEIKDIKSEIYRKLPDWHLRDELKGWVRAEEAASPEAMNELARLSKENDELRQKVSVSVEKFDGLSFEEMVDILKKDKRTGGVTFREESGALWDDYPQKHLFIPQNVGHLFDLCMDFLGNGVRGGQLPLQQEEKVQIDYSFYALNRHSLTETMYRSVDVTSRHSLNVTTYTLSEMGKRFRNRLLAYGDKETRWQKLWDVELADEKTVQQER